MGYKIEMDREEIQRYREVILETIGKSKIGLDQWNSILNSRILYEKKYGEHTSNPNKAKRVLDELVKEKVLIESGVFGIKYFQIAPSGSEEFTPEKEFVDFSIVD